MEISSIRPLLAAAVPVIGAVAILLTRNRPNVRDACSVIAAATQLLIVATMVPPVHDGDTLHFTLSEFLPQAPIEFRVDPLGILLALTASFLWLLTSIYAIGYMRALHEHAQTRFYAFFSLTLGTTMAIAFAGNLVTFYMFYEAMTFITYPLVAHHGTEEDHKAGQRYLYYQLGTSIAFLLPAIISTFAISGTFSFTPGGVFAEDAARGSLIVVYLLFLAGSAKAAIIPFHMWLPSAMVAPTPVSALLHAVAVVNVGVFGVLRVMFDVFGRELLADLNLDVVTMIVVSFTILMASLRALQMDHLKALLAYSTIGQLSYMILGAALLNRNGMTGGLIHIVNHSVSKITLFFCAGSILIGSGRTRISELNGLARYMPWTMAAFAVGSLSIVGIPPTAGFVTKWHLVIGSLEADQLVIFFVLLISTLLTAGYYLPVVGRAFFGSPAPREPTTTGPIAIEAEIASHHNPGPDATPREAPPMVVAPLLVTALLTVVLGLYPHLVLVLVRDVFA